MLFSLFLVRTLLCSFHVHVFLRIFVVYWRCRSAHRVQLVECEQLLKVSVRVLLFNKCKYKYIFLTKNVFRLRKPLFCSADWMRRGVTRNKKLSITFIRNWLTSCQYELCMWILDIISMSVRSTTLCIDDQWLYTSTIGAFGCRCRRTHLFRMHKGEMFEQTGLMQSKYQRNVIHSNMDFLADGALRAEKWHIEYVCSLSKTNRFLSQRTRCVHRQTLSNCWHIIRFPGNLCTCYLRLLLPLSVERWTNMYGINSIWCDDARRLPVRA